MCCCRTGEDGPETNYGEISDSSKQQYFHALKYATCIRVNDFVVVRKDSRNLHVMLSYKRSSKPDLNSKNQETPVLGYYVLCVTLIIYHCAF